MTMQLNSSDLNMKIFACIDIEEGDFFCLYIARHIVNDRNIHSTRAMQWQL